MITAYVVRHGQTEWNLAGRLQGRADSPLTALGRAQAIASAARLAECDPDALYCSPLGRARQTAAAVSAACGLPVRVLDGLAELDAGQAEGVQLAELRNWPEAVTRAADRYAHRWPGGESYPDAEPRARAALAAIRADGHQRVAIVSHGQLGRLLLAELLGWTPDQALAYGQGNGVIVEVDVPTRTWRELS
jgi:probable phosphoglycerate mutase